MFSSISVSLKRPSHALLSYAMPLTWTGGSKTSFWTSALSFLQPCAGHDGCLRSMSGSSRHYPAHSLRTWQKVRSTSGSYSCLVHPSVILGRIACRPATGGIAKTCDVGPVRHVRSASGDPVWRVSAKKRMVMRPLCRDDPGTFMLCPRCNRLFCTFCTYIDQCC